MLSCIPVRAEGKSQAELVTQLLYGETYSVLESTSEWTKIKIDFDGYEGWISSNQYAPPQFAPQGIQNKVVFTQVGRTVYPLGSALESASDLESPSIITLAEQFLESPYLWGGKTFMGIDCSGFMQVIHKANDIQLPRDASQQVHLGKEVFYGDHQEGDLAFFSSESGRITHVGLLLDGNRIIHAAGKVRIDSFNESGIISNGKQTHVLYVIKRL